MSRYISNLHVCEIHVAYTVTFLDPNVLVYRVAVCLVYVMAQNSPPILRAHMHEL